MRPVEGGTADPIGGEILTRIATRASTRFLRRHSGFSKSIPAGRRAKCRAELITCRLIRGTELAGARSRVPGEAVAEWEPVHSPGPEAIHSQASEDAILTSGLVACAESIHARPQCRSRMVFTCERARSPGGRFNCLILAEREGL